MSVRNGNHRFVRPTPKLERLSNVARIVLMKLCDLPPPARFALLLTLLVLVASLSGCATPTPPETLPRNPRPPQLSEPIPQKSYSSKAQELIKSWRERLMGM